MTTVPVETRNDRVFCSAWSSNDELSGRHRIPKDRETLHITSNGKCVRTLCGNPVYKHLPFVKSVFGDAVVCDRCVARQNKLDGHSARAVRGHRI